MPRAVVDAVREGLILRERNSQIAAGSSGGGGGFCALCVTGSVFDETGGRGVGFPVDHKMSGGGCVEGEPRRGRCGLNLEGESGCDEKEG